MATALQEAMVKIARLEAQASIKVAMPAPGGAAGSDSVVTAQ